MQQLRESHNLVSSSDLTTRLRRMREPAKSPRAIYLDEQKLKCCSSYANCPNDSGVTSVQQYQTQYCAAASVYGTTTLMVAPTSTGSLASTTTGGVATNAGATSGSSSASSTAAAASASGSANSGAAAHIAVDMLGFLAAGAVFFL